MCVCPADVAEDDKRHHCRHEQCNRGQNGGDLEAEGEGVACCLKQARCSLAVEVLSRRHGSTKRGARGFRCPCGKSFRHLFRHPAAIDRGAQAAEDRNSKCTTKLGTGFRNR